MLPYDEATLLHLCPRIPPGVALGTLGLQPREAFILSRVDGFTTTSQLADVTNLPMGELVTVLTHLTQLGALGWPDDAPLRPATPQQAPLATHLSTAEIRRYALELASSHADLAEPGDLSRDDKMRILAMEVMLTRLSYWDILGVDAATRPADLKKAYFQASKEFHPDRYFGKNLGSFAARLDHIFRSVKQAYEVLSDASTRSDYAQSRPAPTPMRPATGVAAAAPSAPVEAEHERQARLEKHRQAILAARQKRTGQKPFGKR